MEVKAKLRYAKVGAMKARLVADFIRGKDINRAIQELTFLKQKSAFLIKRLLESAVANADQKQVIDVDNLYIKEISVDQGPTIKRMMYRAKGRGDRIGKRQSHIYVTLGER